MRKKARYIISMGKNRDFLNQHIIWQMKLETCTIQVWGDKSLFYSTIMTVYNFMVNIGAGTVCEWIQEICRGAGTILRPIRLLTGQWLSTVTTGNNFLVTQSANKEPRENEGWTQWAFLWVLSCVLDSLTLNESRGIERRSRLGAPFDRPGVYFRFCS